MLEQSWTVLEQYWTVLEQSWTVLEQSWTVLEQYWTVLEQSWTMLRFGFDPGTDVFGFCGVFRYYNNLVTHREGTKRCPVVYGYEI